MLLLHEWGHLRAAHRVGCAVWSIELYPLHGITRAETPGNAFDTCVIAWGGVVAQAAVALPAILWVTVAGFTPIGVVNALLAMFGWFSGVIAVFNLLPLGRLDGATAWRIVPLWWRRRARRRKRPPSHRPGGGGWVH